MEIRAVLELIKIQCRGYGAREDVVAEYDSLVNYVGSLNMSIGAGALDAFEPDIRTHVTGKRYHDVLQDFLKTHDLLRMVVEENVDLNEVRRAIDDAVDEVRSTQEGGRLPSSFVENVSTMVAIEKQKVRNFLEGWKEDPRNTFEYVEAHHRGMVARGKGRFTSKVLVGGLIPREDITEEVIKDFDMRFQKYNYYLGSNDDNQVNLAIDAKKELGELYVKHYRTLWEIEDNVAYTVYLKGVPLRKMVPDSSGMDVETKITRQEFSRRIAEAEAMVEEKWNDRLEVATHILVVQADGENRRHAHGEIVARNLLMREVVFGIQKVLAAVVKKVGGADWKIREVLNAANTDAKTGRSFQFALNKADVSGIMVNLKKQYAEPPVTMIFSSLRDLFMNEEDFHPSKLKTWIGSRLLVWIGSRLLVWGEYELFDYFTPDLLFTFVTIQKLKNTELARRAYQGVMDVMTARPEEFTKDALKGRRGMEVMPLYQLVMDMIEMEKSRIAFQRLGGPRDHQSRGVGRGQPKEEEAHMTEMVKGSDQKVKEIRREENKFSSKNGRQMPYTATLEACASCAGSGQGHVPRCFQGQCRKCNMFGHMGAECGQQL